MNKIFLSIAAAGMTLSLSTIAAQQVEPASETPQTDNAGLAAWEKIYEVASHPRCANCHVEDGRPMWSGEHYGETRVHGMYVGGDPAMLLGNPGLMCNTCHMPENSEKMHGPPGAHVWHLPPAEMVWWNKSSSEVCEQLKDPERNGGRSFADLEKHVANDSLVAWGWDPGPGREPAPYSAEELAAFIVTWAGNGAPCPEAN